MIPKKYFYIFIVIIVLSFSSWFGFYLMTPNQNRIMPKSSDGGGEYGDAHSPAAPTPEEAMSAYIDAYQNHNAVKLSGLMTPEWYVKNKISRQDYVNEVSSYLNYTEKRRGKIISWKLPKFRQYQNFALSESIVQRADGSRVKSMFVLVKVKDGWKIDDFFVLK